MNELERVVSEISRRELLLGTLGLGALGLITVGCGGAGAPSGGSTTNVTGMVTAPGGLAGASLQVVSPYSGATTLASGKFTASVNPGFPTLVHVIEPNSGRLVLMGLIDPAESSHTLDAKTTSSALLFVALGGANLPPANRKELLDLIKADSNLPSLTSAVQTALAADPYALENGSPQVITALSTAASAVKPAAKVQGSKAFPMDSSIPPQLLIEPSGEVDGATFVQASSPLGVQVQNSKRRYASVYTYLVAHVDSTGNRTDITPKQVGSIMDVPETASLLNLRTGWQPVTSGAIPLTIQGTDTKSIYELIYLCPVYGGSDPSVFFLPRYASEVPNWRKTLSDLEGAVFIGFIANFIFEGLGMGGALAWTASELTPIITELTTVSSTVGTLLVNAQAGYPLIPLTKDLLGALAGDNVILRNFTKGIAKLLEKAAAQQALELEAGTAAAARYVALRAAIRVFLIVGAIGLAADVAAVALDTSVGNTGDLITATVFQPKVLITPTNQPYNPGDSFVITAGAPGAKGTLTYHWSLTGSNLANLSDGSQVGSGFDSDKSFVTLATTPSTQGDLVVTVEAFTVSGATKTSVGKATATYSQQSVTGLKYQFFDTFSQDGTGGSANAFVVVPLSSSSIGTADIEMWLDGVHEFTIYANVPTAGAHLDPMTQNGWNNATNLGVNNQFDYRNPSWDGSHLIYPFIFGDTLVAMVNNELFGSASVSGATQSTADADVRAFVGHVKVKVTMHFTNAPNNPVFYST